MHDVLLERAAERDLRRLSRGVSVRIVRCMRGLAENPRPSGSRKLSGSANDWRIRVGDYRVVYEIDDRIQAVKVMRIRHRREAYR